MGLDVIRGKERKGRDGKVIIHVKDGKGKGTVPHFFFSSQSSPLILKVITSQCERKDWPQP